MKKWRFAMNGHKLSQLVLIQLFWLMLVSTGYGAGDTYIITDNSNNYTFEKVAGRDYIPKASLILNR